MLSLGLILAVNSVMLIFVIIILQYYLKALILGISLLFYMGYFVVDMLTLVPPDHFTLDALL